LTVAGPPRQDARPPRVLDPVHRATRAGRYRGRMEGAGSAWVPRFIRFHCRGAPRAWEGPEVGAFLSALAAGSNVNAFIRRTQAAQALLFLYREMLGKDLPWLSGIVRPRRPGRLPVVLGREDVTAVPGRLNGPSRLMATLPYGAGARARMLPTWGEGHRPRVAAAYRPGRQGTKGPGRAPPGDGARRPTVPPGWRVWRRSISPISVRGPAGWSSPGPLAGRIRDPAGAPQAPALACDPLAGGTL